jgi:hypothetical protein
LADSNEGWFNLMSNPRGHMLKKTMFEILKERYPKHEQIIDRVSHSLATDKDIKDFVSMMVEIYEVGFVRAVDEHREKLSKLGFEVKITSPNS